MEQQINTKKYRINRTSGAASTDGVDFENYMFLQVLLRLLEDDTIEEFYIAQNVSDVLPFDDIVFRVKYKLPGSTGPVSVTKLFLVQLKYIKTRGISIEALTATDGKGQFQLQKYFSSYKSLLKNISQLKDKILQECKPQDMTFIILTNAPCSLGDDNYSIDNLCRKLLETNTSESNVFQFTSSERYNNFYQQLNLNKNLIDQQDAVQKFMKQLVFFTEGSNIFNVKESLKKKLKQYFSEKDTNLDDALQRAIRFLTKNSAWWWSRYSGAFFDVTFNYQGVPVKLTDIVKFWDLPSCRDGETTNNLLHENKKLQFINRIIVQHMCLDNPMEYVCVGKPMSAPEFYYVDRIPRKNDQSKLDYFRESELYKEQTNKLSIDESFILLCAGPGIGKSSYFTYQANLLKSKNPEKFIIRTDLVNFSQFLRDLVVNEDSPMATAMKFLLKIAGIATCTAEHDLFALSIHKSKAMVVFLDGVDEISPHYYEKLLVIIGTIRNEFDVQLWVSTRPIVQKRIEEDLGVKSWTLESFFMHESHEFIVKYCGADKYNIFRNLTTGIRYVPIFCKMFGDVINNNHTKDLNEIANDAELYDKFVDTMYEVYNKEKKKHDVSISATKRDLEKLKKIALEDHEKVALLEIFHEEELSELKWNIRNECKEFLEDISSGEEKAGLIVNIVDEKPRFIHRNIAEYFCGRWFAKNHSKYHEYVKKYKLSLEVDYHMSHKLNDLHGLLKYIIMYKFHEINEFLKTSVEELNIVDVLGRDLLYYVDMYSSLNGHTRYNLIGRIKISNDMVQNMKQYYNFDTQVIINFNLLSCFLDSLDIDNDLNHRSLMGLIFIWLLKRYKTFNGFHVFTLYFYLKYCKNVSLHVKIINVSEKLNVESVITKENINSKDDLGLTGLHLATAMYYIRALNLLCEHQAEYSNDNILGVYPHQLWTYDGSREILKSLHKAASIIEEEDTLIANVMTEDYVAQNLPLHDAVQKNDLDRVKKESAGVGRVDSRGRTALHVAAACNETHLDIYEHLFSKNIIYTRDKNGFYAHDYCCNDSEERYLRRCNLHRYGVTTHLAKLPENKQSLFGKRIADIVTELESYLDKN